MNIEAAKRRRVKEKGEVYKKKRMRHLTMAHPFLPFSELIGLYLYYTYKGLD